MPPAQLRGNPSRCERILDLFSRKVKAQTSSSTGVFCDGSTREGGPIRLSDTLGSKVMMNGRVKETVISKIVMGRGNVGSQDDVLRIVIIGEAPGKDEARQGLPFVGKSGEYLVSLMKACKRLSKKNSKNHGNDPQLKAVLKSVKQVFSRDLEEIAYITNVCCIRPYEFRGGKPTDRKPTPIEIAEHGSIVLEQLREIQPHYILCLGDTAYSFVKNQLSLGQMFNDPIYEGHCNLVREHHANGILPKPQEFTISAATSGAVGALSGMCTHDLDFIKIDGVDHPIFYDGIRHPSAILRSAPNVRSHATTAISEKIVRSVLEILSKGFTSYSPILQLNDLPRKQVEEAYAKHEKLEREKNESRAKLLKTYLTSPPETDNSVSVSLINQALGFSGVYAEETEKPWTDPQTVFYRRPHTESLEEIAAKSEYSIRLDYLKYLKDKDMFVVSGRSEHGDSVYVELDVNTGQVPASDYKTFQFAGFIDIPQFVREYLKTKSQQSARVVYETFQDILCDSNAPLPYMDVLRLAAGIRHDSEFTDAGEFQTDGNGGTRSTGITRSGTDYVMDDSTAEDFYQMEDQSDEEMVDISGLVDQDNGETSRLGEDQSASESAKEEPDKLAVIYPHYDYSKGWREEIDMKDPETALMLELWQAAITHSMVRKGYCTPSEAKQITMSYRQYYNNRMVRMRYDDVQWWIAVRCGKFSVLKNLERTVKDLEPVKSQVPKLFFADFVRTPEDHFSLYCGIRAKSWFYFNPNLVKPHYVRGEGIMRGWNREEITALSSCDIHMRGSIDHVFPRGSEGEWIKSGPTRTLAWDIEMLENNRRFPTPTTAAIIGVCFQLQDTCDNTNPRKNEEFRFTLRKATLKKRHIKGADVASTASHERNVRLYCFDSEEKMLRAIAYFTYQIGADVDVGHNSIAFDMVNKIKRSRFAGIVYGYNVPGLGIYPGCRNTIVQHEFSSRAYGSQIFPTLYQPGTSSIDTLLAYIRSGMKYPSYSLDSLARIILKMSKSNLPYHAIMGYFWGTAEQVGVVVDYCGKDVELTLGLLNHAGFIGKYTALSQVTGTVFTDEFIKRGAGALCAGAIAHTVERPEGLDIENPRKPSRKYLIVDWKTLIAASPESSEEYVEKELNELVSEDGPTTDAEWDIGGLGKDIKSYLKMLKDLQLSDSLSLEDFSKEISGSKSNLRGLETRFGKIDIGGNSDDDEEDDDDEDSDNRTEGTTLGGPALNSSAPSSPPTSPRIFVPTKKFSSGKDPSAASQSPAGSEESEKIFTYDLTHAALKAKQPTKKKRRKVASKRDPPKKKDHLVKKNGKWILYSQVIKEQAKKKVKQYHSKRTDFVKKTYVGAKVFETRRGKSDKPIGTFDFMSLYPSIQIGDNLCSSTALTKSEIKCREISPADLYDCPVKSLPMHLLYEGKYLLNKVLRDKASEPMHSVRQAYWLTVYENQPDRYMYSDKTLVQIKASNLDMITSRTNAYFDGKKYLEWFLKRYGLEREEITDDFTLLNARTGKQDKVYLCTNEVMGMGLIPGNAVILLGHRSVAKQKMAAATEKVIRMFYNLLQDALKVIANSIYGIGACIFNNIAHIGCAANVTMRGQEYITRGAEAAMELFTDPDNPLNRGYTQEQLNEGTILWGGDTDSCFMSYGCAPDLESAIELALWLAWYYVSLGMFGKPLTLAFEKIYLLSAWFQRKKYAAVKIADGNLEPFLVKSAIETFHELFPRSMWDEIFSAREIKVIRINEIDEETIARERVGAISCELKEAHEVFYTIEVLEDCTRNVHPVTKVYRYYEIQKVGDVAWWKAGVLKDVTGKVYSGADIGKLIGRLKSHLYSLNFEELRNHLDRPRYSGDNFVWTNHADLFCRGIGSVRRDGFSWAKRTLSDFLKEAMLKANYVEAGKMVIERGKRLLEGDIPFHELIKTASYGKTYKNTPVHITAVQHLQKHPEFGIPVPNIGDRIPYVIVKGSDPRISTRGRHPQTLEFSGEVVDLDAYYKAYVSLLAPICSTFFGPDFALLLHKDNISLNRTINNRVPVGLQSALRQIRECENCGEKIRDTDDLICGLCIPKVFKNRKNTPVAQKISESYSEIESVHSRCMEICRKCTGTKESPCTSFGCENYAPRMESESELRKLTLKLESIDLTVSKWHQGRTSQVMEQESEPPAKRKASLDGSVLNQQFNTLLENLS